MEKYKHISLASNGRIHSFYDEEEPSQVFIIKLGTEDEHGYAVIHDDPWGGNMEPMRMSAEEIEKKFNIKIPL